MPKTKVEVYDKDQLIYPYIESDHVTFSNGMKVSEMLDQSISMPTVTHEDLSFKVGVGDQDVSSAIVDSSVSKMTIKGKTYQNILPEPSTHVLTNNKEMFKVNEGLDPNVEIVDGVSKSAILSGSTKYRDILSNKIYDSYESATNVWSTNKYKLWCAQDSGATSELNGTIASGTDIVTLDFHTINHSTYKLTGNCTYKKVVFYDSNQTFISSTRTAATTDDLVVNNIPSNARYVRFAFFPHADNTGSCSIVDENNNPINLRQIQLISCKMPVLTTSNHTNLFDGLLEHGYLGSASGQEIDNANAVRSVNYIEVNPNTTYTISSEDYYGEIYITNYDINKKFVSHVRYTTPSASHTFTTSDNVYYIRFNTNDGRKTSTDAKFQIYNNEPYKVNILSTPSDLELRGIGDVQDTLDCLTGEVVERVGEIVLDGSQPIFKTEFEQDNTAKCCLVRIKLDGVTVGSEKGVYTNICCDKYKVVDTIEEERNSETIKLFNQLDYTEIRISILKTKLSSCDRSGINAYLSSNPITVQYQLATESIKTVDLSSSGNWEKIVLDGRQGVTWQDDPTKAFYIRENRLEKLQDYSRAIITDTGLVVNNYRNFVDGCNEVQITGYPDTQNKYPNENWLYIRVPNIKSDVNALKQYLSQNPITVWFQTETHQGSTQVKQPIFFKDGHIQLSSGTDNSLIPTLDYQAKTSNSYVMDLMKTNTHYTMKAKSASGTFTIDGTSYGAGTNGTFTTPSSMTNKLLVMSNKTNEEVMILEGDVVSKTIPYFKGIKSAFENEDKIEVLSTGKNLADVTTVYTNMNSGYSDRYWTIVQKDENGFIAKVKNYSNTGTHRGFPASLKVYVEPNTTYYLSYDTKDNGVAINSHAYVYSNCETWGGSLIKQHGEAQNGFTFTTHSDTEYIVIGLGYALLENNKEVEVSNLILSRSKTTYEPYKSNSTKIPLLSPLRSLPNGVYDELIIDRENNKAKIIQRVGKVTYDGTDVWGTYTVHQNNVRIQTTLPNCVRRDTADFIYAICDKLLSIIWNHSWLQNYNLVTVNHANIHLQLSDTTMTKQQMLSWLTQNPITVYYELETPIITEVDIEGFPYIYKDGHIFLNGEIVPVTEITYSINQCQQISASNEDIIRHEKELTYLQKLIAQYVQVDYESALLSLKV